MDRDTIMKLKLKGEDLFLIFIYLNTFSKGIGLDNSNLFYAILMVIGLGALGIKFMLHSYTKKELTWILLLLAVGLGNFFATWSVTFFITCISLAGMKNVDIDKLFYGMYKIRLVTFAAVFFSALIGIIDKNEITVWRSGGFVTRYGMGYGHPNTLHITFFILVTFIFLFYSNKMKFYHFIFFFLLNVWIYRFSASRGGFLCTTLFILSAMFLKWKWFKKIVLYIPVFFFFGILIFTFILPFLLEVVPALIEQLDWYLNGRISYTLQILSRYDMTLFGQAKTADISEIIDNGYLRLYFESGVMGLLMWIVIMLQAFWNMKKEKNYSFAVISIAFVVYMFVESFSSNIFMNYIMILAGKNVYNKMEKDIGDKILYEN